MEQAHTQDTGHDTVPTGVGWRIFQIVGLLTALTWLVSYLVLHDASETMLTIFGLENPVWLLFGLSYLLSPLLSLVLIAIAVWPGALAVLNRDDWVGLVARGALVVVPTLWLLSGFAGGTDSMVNQMLAQPLSSTPMLPVVGGNLLHLVFQHWFQGFAAILLALVPGQFSTLTESSKPAGIQCAVVQCG